MGQLSYGQINLGTLWEDGSSPWWEGEILQLICLPQNSVPGWPFLIGVIPWQLSIPSLLHPWRGTGTAGTSPRIKDRELLELSKVLICWVIHHLELWLVSIEKPLSLTFLIKTWVSNLCMGGSLMQSSGLGLVFCGSILQGVNIYHVKKLLFPGHREGSMVWKGPGDLVMSLSAIQWLWPGVGDVPSFVKWGAWSRSSSPALSLWVWLSALSFLGTFCKVTVCFWNLQKRNTCSFDAVIRPGDFSGIKGI